MNASAPLLDESRDRRRAARDQAADATQRWLDSVVAALAALAGEAGLRGGDGVIVLRAETVPAASEEDVEREQLASALFANEQTRVQLGPAAGSRVLWAEAVELWGELRDVLCRTYLCDIPISAILDLDTGFVALYDPYFCPDYGPDPDMVFDLSPAPAGGGELDAFQQLLVDVTADNEKKFDQFDLRLSKLLTRYAITPPTEQAHPEGVDHDELYNGDYEN